MSTWTTSINAVALRNLCDLAIADGAFDYQEMLGVLNTAALTGITASELGDLQTIYVNSTSLFANAYLKTITYDVIYGNPANKEWWGGTTTLNVVQTIGNIAVGTSESSAQKVVDEWFLGTDLPMPVAGGDTATGKASTSVFTYGTAGGNLFVNGISPTDVYQGSIGDCYFVSTLGAIADANPDLISQMFTDNGNGTYGVKFYNYGTPVYTTVNMSLPVTTANRLGFAGNPTDSLNGELWVALAEKAYAQINAQMQLSTEGSWDGENSYQVIGGGGLAQPIKQITGLNYTYYSSYYTSLADPFASGFNQSDSSATYKQTLIDKLNAGAIGWLGSWGATTGANGNRELVSGHAFMLLGYNAATDKFIIRNPWGDNSSGTYNAQFELSIDQFWNSSVKAIVALSDNAIADKVYNYTVSSTAGTSVTGVTEGGQVTFTITRSDSGTASTVYVSTMSGTATNGSDYAQTTMQPITFGANETVKTLKFDTLVDSLVESTENFRLDLWKAQTDTVVAATGTAYIKDSPAPAYTYSLANNAGTSGTAVLEGGDVSVTVTRSGSGSASTVYLSTRTGTAVAADYQGVDKMAVNFAAYETVKTVLIKTVSDGSAEPVESFAVDLYANPGDTTYNTTTTAYIQDVSAPSFTYTVTSTASTQAGAQAEGGKIAFTITRSGTGMASTIYASTAAGSASSSDYVGVDKLKIDFAANQKVATVEIDTSSDWWLEANEYFRLELYKNAADTTSFTYGGAWIKDAPVAAYNYSVSSNAASTGTAATEGGAITFTITRDGSGTASTVYVSTTAALADGGDITLLDKQAVSFAAYETTKTVTVQTHTDSATEGYEYFYLDLFRNLTDASYTTYATGYIQDAAAPAYTYSVASSAATSSAAALEGGNVTFTITRSGSGTASTIYVSTTPGTSDSSDYSNLTKSPVTFEAYETTKTVTVPIYLDSTTESTEYFWLDVFKNYADTMYDTFSIGYVNDAPAPSFDYTVTSSAGSSAGAASEGNSVTFTVTRSGTGAASTVYVSTTAGTAGSSDYGAFTKNAVTFAAYETVKTVTVPLYLDSNTEGTEYFWLDLYKNYTDTTWSTYGTGYVKDAVAPSYTYAVTSNASSPGAAVNEGGNVTFTITRGGSATASTVYVSTTAGLADGSDYTVQQKSAVTFAAGETTKTVTVPTYLDGTAEGVEYFWLDLFKNYSDTDWSTYGTAYIADTTVTDYSYTVSSTAGTSANACTEGGPVIFTVTRNGTGSSSTVYLTTTNGTADNGYDFSSLAKYPLTFGPTETSKTIFVSTYQDGTTEGNEYFWLDLYENYSDASWSTYGTGYIKDAAASAFNYTITSSAGTSGTAASEGHDITFTITRSGTGSSSTVYLSTTDGKAGSSDYSTLSKSSLTFASNETSKTVTVHTYLDSLLEGTENFSLQLYKGYADNTYSAFANAYIQDSFDDGYQYTITSDSASPGSAMTEGGQIAFTITRSSSGTASTVYVNTSLGTLSDAASASDFVAQQMAPVTFGANETTKTVYVATVADDITEGTEYFWVDLYKSPTDYDWTAYGMGYIKDPAPDPGDTSYEYFISSDSGFENPVNEGGTVTFTITRSGSGTASTVWVSTTPAGADGSDYFAISKAEVHFAADETTKTVTVQTKVDDLVETNEAFFLDLFTGYDHPIYDFYGTAVIQDGFGISGSAPLGAPLSALTSEPVVQAYAGRTVSEVANGYAFAAVKSDGSVVTWGDAARGGDSSSVATKLNGLVDVAQVYSSAGAFAALRADGTVVAWGDPNAGGDIGTAAALLTGAVAVTRIASTASAFAALRADGSVATWGHSAYGGDSSAVAPQLNGGIDVTGLYSNSSAFAALRQDGSVVTWGYGFFGGDSSPVAAAINGTTDVVRIQPTGSAFAALRTDGSVVAWGNSMDGGSLGAAATSLDGTVDAVKLFSTVSAFAALRTDGSVIAWGDADAGGTAPAGVDGTTDVTDIRATTSAFAALRADGSVVAWGESSSGGDASAVAASLDGTTDVVSLYATQSAFAALRADGSVVTWGYGAYGGDSSGVAAALAGTNDVVSIYSNDHAFAAIRADGSVVTWGDELAGGDSSTLASQLDGTIDVSSVLATGLAFTALRSDGSVVTWGDASYGGQSTSVASQLVNVVSGASVLQNDSFFDTAPHVVQGTAGVDSMIGATGADTLNAQAGNDWMFGSGGNDALQGGAGIDIAAFSGNAGRYTIANGTGSATVTDSYGFEGVDTLTGVERLQFADKNIAIDLDGNAGSVVKILHVVFGPALVSVPSYVGIGLQLMDGGMTYQSLMQGALDFWLGANASSTQVVDAMYSNVVGVHPSASDLAYYAGFIDSGLFTAATLGMAVGDLIGVGGLAATGVEYV